MRISAVVAIALLATLPASVGCDGGGQSSNGGPPTSPGDADPNDVEVIEAWSSALREGDVAAAARFFALPSVAENGFVLRIRNRRDARLFNSSLPCGAILIRAESEGDFTTASFELTERPGPGVCGPGSGEKAETSFVIQRGKIVEWRRVSVAGVEPAPGEAV